MPNLIDIPITSAHDVWDLARRADLGERLQKWSENSDHRRVAWAWGYTHVAPTLEEVRWALDHSDHALREAEKNKVYLGLTPFTDRRDWPMTFLFYRAMVDLHKIHNFDEWWNYLYYDTPEDYITPVGKAYREQGRSTQEIINGLKWRLGNAWQSCMREMHFVAVLHDEGYLIHTHPLVDVELKVDAWIGDHLVCIYVSNPEREDALHPNHIFPIPPFTVHNIPVDRQGHGIVWLVADDHIMEFCYRAGLKEGEPRLEIPKRKVPERMPLAPGEEYPF
jgi:hypothetical protein